MGERPRGFSRRRDDAAPARKRSRTSSKNRRAFHRPTLTRLLAGRPQFPVLLQNLPPASNYFQVFSLEWLAQKTVRDELFDLFAPSLRFIMDAGDEFWLQRKRSQREFFKKCPSELVLA